MTLYDNFSSGQEWHYRQHVGDPRLCIVRADVAELRTLSDAMSGHEVVIHLASNPDIAKAVTDPDIDFREGTLLTRNVLEAMRVSGVKILLYASGSGVYGDLGEHEAHEDHGPLIPISTYGASKLSGEALISSYCYMFDLRARAFRFGNVVGARQTHGVGFDFVRALLRDPKSLRILGDGSQSKSYVHVSDVVSAVLLACDKELPNFRPFNVATGDYITVTEIAKLAIESLRLDENSVHLQYTGGNRGWKGDVPIVRLNTDRIRALGWKNRFTSREALKQSMTDMLAELRRASI